MTVSILHDKVGKAFDLSDLIDRDDMTWKPRSAEMFSSSRTRSSQSYCDMWNAKHAGMPVFTRHHGVEGKRGSLFGKTIYQHQVVWAFHYGTWPEKDIDHINGDRNDNSITNLRLVSHAENMRNKAKPKSNTSGYVGVVWSKSEKKWQSRITKDGKRVHLGYYVCIDDAVSARSLAEKEMGFHKNHGREAKL